MAGVRECMLKAEIDLQSCLLVCVVLLQSCLLVCVVLFTHSSTLRIPIHVALIPTKKKKKSQHYRKEKALSAFLHVPLKKKNFF